jgi:ESCRT-II complex subunit VPS22
VNLQVLGSGFEVISVGRRKLVRSVPTELNKDHNGILGLAQVCGFNIVVFNAILPEAFSY